MNMNASKTNGVKLLAAVMAMAMIFTGVAVIASDNGVDAATWNMDGDINADQPIRAGTDAVATGPFNITNNSELIIEPGASFVINEGVKVTVKSGSTLTIMSGAAVEINGTLVIEDKATLQNGADYDGVNTVSKHYTGVVVNGTIDAEKGATITGAPVADAITKPTTGTGDGSGITVVAPASEYVTGALSITSWKNTTDAKDSSYTAVLSGATIAKHLNANADEGYWVAVQLSSAITGLSEKDVPVDITINGRASDSDDVSLDGGAVNVWLNAGSVYNVVVKAGEKTINLKVDTTQVVGDQYDVAGDSGNVKMVGGTIVVGADGTIETSSSNNTKSTFEHQTILMNVGATANINSLVIDVDLQAMPTTNRNPYTYGALGINTESGWESPTNVVDLAFTVTSEKISSAFTAAGDANKTSRATNYILNIDGDVNASNFIRVVATPAISGQYDTLYYPNSDGEYSGVPMYGIVSITGTLDVNGSKAQFSVVPNAVLDVTGTLNIGGNKDGTANTYLYGTINVSGAVNIDSVNPTSGTALSKFSINNNTYLNIIGSGVVTIDDYDISSAVSANANINGAAYVADDATIITALQTALTGAAAANEDTVHVFGYGAVEDKALANPYIIPSDITIPDDMTICIDGIVSVAEGATLTISVDAEIETDGKGLIDVAGTVMDYSMYEFGNDATEDYASVSNGKIGIKAEVRSTDADDTYFMYTTLKTSLAGTAGTVELYGDVEVEGTLTIPAGFTVDLSGHDMLVKNDATLVIDGVVDSTDTGSSITVVKKDTTNNKGAGTVTLNNMIVNPVVVDDATSPAAVVLNGFTATGTIGDYENVSFALAPEVAAANSATLESITAVGEFSYGGTLTFTAGENTPTNEVITIRSSDTDGNTNNNVISIGTIVLDGFGLTIDGTDGAFTGTVQSDVGAVSFNAAKYYSIFFTEEDTGDQYVTSMNLSVVASQTADGGVTIASGTVYLGSAATFGDDQDKILTIASGATLNVEDYALSTAARATGEGVPTGYSAIVVDGTLNISLANGISMNATSSIQIDGTMNVTNGITFAGNVYVDGTLAVTDGERTTGKVTVDNTMYVNGTVSGVVALANNDIIITYPGATVDTENLEDNSGNAAASTQFYINGEVYMTAYGANSTTVASVMGKETFELEGYTTPDMSKNSSATEYKSWFTDAGMTQNLAVSATMQYTSAVYTKVSPISVDNIRVSIGEGLQVYVDGVRVTTTYLDGTQAYVGDHVIEVTISPSYTGEVVITFNGQTIQNGGTFTITSEMANPTADEVVLSVTSQLSINTGSSDDGMGLTEILLVILVILIVVMAIMVALRLMRS